MPAHTKEQADLMTKVVQGVADPGDDFKLHEGMEESFGQMASEYMPDIHRELSGGQAGGRDPGGPLSAQWSTGHLRRTGGHSVHVRTGAEP